MVYLIAWIIALGMAIWRAWVLSREVPGDFFILLYSIRISILYMGLPLVVFFSIIITIIKYRRQWKKVLIVYFIIGLIFYLIGSSILFVSFVRDYNYSVNCLNLLEGKPHTLESYDYSGCSAHKESSKKQNYIDYLTEKKEGGISRVIFLSFFTYTLLIIPFWLIGILYPIIFLYIPT